MTAADGLGSGGGGGRGCGGGGAEGGNRSGGDGGFGAAAGHLVVSVSVYQLQRLKSLCITNKISQDIH